MVATSFLAESASLARVQLTCVALAQTSNTHGSNCNGKPLVALKKEQDQADRGSEAPGEIHTSSDREMQQVRSCA